MAHIQYKEEDGESVTLCPFGKDRFVGSKNCEHCYYHAYSYPKPEHRVICNYDIAHPDKSVKKIIKGWEYNIIILHGLDLKDKNEKFNKLGSDGWELVTCNCSQAYFKREIQNG